MRTCTCLSLALLKGALHWKNGDGPKAPLELTPLALRHYSREPSTGKMDMGRKAVEANSHDPLALLKGALRWESGYGPKVPLESTLLTLWHCSREPSVGKAAMGRKIR